MPKIRVTKGTDNVLRDIGIPDAETIAAKLGLAVHINKILARRRNKARSVTKLLGLTARNLSLIRAYKVDELSLEKLMGLLNALNRDIEIIVRKPTNARRKGRITLLAA
jgi:DNA-binding Xre family transcriptional regulator